MYSSKSFRVATSTLSVALSSVCLPLNAESPDYEQLLKEINSLKQIVQDQAFVVDALRNKIDAYEASQSSFIDDPAPSSSAADASTNSSDISVAEAWTQNIDFYGQFHASFDVLEDGAHLSGNSSRVGFRGNHPISDTLSTVWQVEISINLDEGSNTDFNLRDTFVGFSQEKYGTLQFGRMDSAFERLHRWTDFFDDQIGDSRNIVGFGPGTHGFDNREDNSIKYISPEFGGGFTSMSTFTAPEGDQDTSTFATNLAYRNDEGLMVAAGFEIHGDALPASNEENEMGLRLVGSYQADRIKYSGILEYLMNVGGFDGVDRFSGGLGAAYSIDDQNTLKGQFRYTEGVADGFESFELSTGFDHLLSESTKVYFVYAMTFNDDLASNGVSGGGHGTTVFPEAGEDTQGVSVGVIHAW